MSWPAARPLEELTTLTPGGLTVFVAGPGQGEGLAVAMPHGGWLLVDGCRTARGFPLLELHRRYRRGADDGVDALVLTHPHEDHAAGVASCVAELRPAAVGLVGTPGLPGLRAALSAASAGLDPRVTSAALKKGAVRTALEAMERLEFERPGTLVALHDGAAVPLRAPDVRGTVWAPARDLLAERLAAGGIPRGVANEWSAVIELEFGAARIVLGGDLPSRCATGWGEVLGRAPQLGQHRGLKLPHHGSPGAYHPALHTKSAERRCWWVTPYNASRLPPVEDLLGLPRLLKREPSLLLTALPAARRLQPRHAEPGVVSLDRVEVRRLEGHPRATLLRDAVAVAPPAEPGPFDAVWGVAFDDTGLITGRWRGPVALELCAPPPAAHPRSRRRRGGRAARP